MFCSSPLTSLPLFILTFVTWLPDTLTSVDIIHSNTLLKMDFSNNTSSNFNLFNTFNNFNNANDFQGTSTLQQPSDMQDQSSIQPGIFAVDQFLFAPQSENTVVSFEFVAVTCTIKSIKLSD